MNSTSAFNKNASLTHLATFQAERMLDYVLSDIPIQNYSKS
jgi:hypothetical protein